MKKLISVVVLLATVVGLFAGCGKRKEYTDLERAAQYLSGMYQTAGKNEAIPLDTDLDVLASVVVDGVSYPVDWSVEMVEGDANAVSIGESKKENHVKIDIPLHSSMDLWFNVTATVSDEAGGTESMTVQYMVQGVVLAGEGMTMEELLEAAYDLDEGESLEGLGVLTGVVSMVNTPYDESYKNVTVTIVVEDRADLPIKCYRMKGEDAALVAPGDVITVSGTLKNYMGTIEFDAGCMLDERLESQAPIPEVERDPGEIIAEAYALEENASMTSPVTLTGTITTVDTPYDDGYQNITVTMVVTGYETQPIKCYRLKGDNADRITEGDVITVTGILMNYNGTVEFGQGCTLDHVSGEHGEVPEAPDDPLKIVDAAFALELESSLPYVATLSGLITKVNTPYDSAYQNITVTMTVVGRESNPIECFRLKGTGVDQLAVGDTITVTGKIKNYSGVVQFDAGCNLDAYTKGPNLPVTKPAQEVEIVDQAYKLQRDEALPYIATLTGKVTELTEGYNTQFKNVTVVILVPGREVQPIKCYRMNGTDVEKVAVGDTITVTGTIKNYLGSVQFDMGCTMTARVPGINATNKVETDPLKIVDAAYSLGTNQEMNYNVSLTGKITRITEAYNSTSKNISVEIKITGRESKPIICYRLSGSNLDELAVNDTITVVGKLKNSAGTVQLINGTLTGRNSDGSSAPKRETDPLKIVDVAYGLKENTDMGYDVTLSGVVSAVKTPFDSGSRKITVEMKVNGRETKPIVCYRLQGTGSDQIGMGSNITVMGRLTNYNGTVEFKEGCLMIKFTPGVNTTAPTDPKKIVDEAYALGTGNELPYTATLSGKVTAINTIYDPSYKNITVTIAVSGREDSPIVCYRMKGKDAENVTVGDTITVTGKIINFNGTIEFGQNCTLDKRSPGGGTVPKLPEDPKQIVDEAFKLGEGESLPYAATLTGVVKSIDEPYNAENGNVSLTITVEGSDGAKDIYCYRVKGEKAPTVQAGDTITVTGTLTRYVSTDEATGEKTDKIEFYSGTIIG